MPCPFQPQQLKALGGRRIEPPCASSLQHVQEAPLRWAMVPADGMRSGSVVWDRRFSITLSLPGKWSSDCVVTRLPRRCKGFRFRSLGTRHSHSMTSPEPAQQSPLGIERGAALGRLTLATQHGCHGLAPFPPTVRWAPCETGGGLASDRVVGEAWRVLPDFPHSPSTSPDAHA